MNGRPLQVAYVYRGTSPLDEPATATCHGARGTVAGYGRHKRAGERPCDRCRDAMNAYTRERRNRWGASSESQTADRLRRKARARALAALARNHSSEFRALQQRALGELLTEEVS